MSRLIEKKSIVIKVGIFFRRLQEPNFLSVCWMIMCIKLIVSPDASERSGFDYFLYLFSIGYFFIKITRNHRHKFNEKRIVLAFLGLVLVSIIGLIGNNDSHAFTSIMGVVVVMTMVLGCAYFSDDIQVYYIVPFFILVVVRFFLLTLGGEWLDNTNPGAVVFLFCGYILSELDRKETTTKKNHLRKVVHLSVFFAVIYIAWKARARTSVAVVLAIVVVFLCFLLWKKNERGYKKLFFVGIISITTLIFLYMNISAFSWYRDVNQYSVSLFDKNIDSSRPALWKDVINNMSGWELIVGKGTGVLPNFRGFQSTHNSYLQLVLQNGMVGLLLLISVFWYLWKEVVTQCQDKVCKWTMSCMVGLIIYNTFECTLLQNKVFLGLCGWIVICMGVVRSRKLNNKRNN